jgi:hypothetical protein
MITITITNAEQIVLEKKGWFMPNVVGAVFDLEAQVEAVVAERVRDSLAREGVAAIVEQVGVGRASVGAAQPGSP